MSSNSINAGVLVLILLCIGSIVLSMDRVAVNQSSTIEQMLAPGDLAEINEHRALFRIEAEPVLVAIQSPILSKTAIALERITAIEKSLQALPEVEMTLSSASIDNYGFGRQQVFSLSETTELILVLIAPASQHLDAAKHLATSIRQSVDAHIQADEVALISGVPQVRAASWQVSQRDSKLIVPLLLVITIFVSLIFFRTYVALALSLLLTSLTTSVCLALQLLIKTEINALVFLVIPVIWAIATLDAFHLYSRTAELTRQKHPSPAAAASKELFMPCLLTTLTTAGCFLTLTLMDTSGMIVNFGLLCAAGAIIAFVLTFTIGQKLLSLYAVRDACPQWPKQFAFRLVNAAQKHYQLTLIVWATFAICALLSIGQLEVANTFPQIFTDDEDIAIEIGRLQALTDTDLNPIDIVIRATSGSGADMQQLASAALLTNNYLNTIAETRLVLPIGLIDEQKIARLAGPEKALDGGLGDGNADITQHLRNWANEEQRAVRLQVFLANTSYQRKQEIIDWLAHFDESMLRHHRLTLSGSGYYYHVTEQRGLRSLIYSSSLSAMIVGFSLLWIVRKKTLALMAMCASTMPAVIVVACMAALNIPWSIALLPMPALLLGLMNDDTIHMVWQAEKSDQAFTDNLKTNALAAGPALLATTFVLSGAVATLFLSGIQSNQYLGLLVPVGLLLAFFSNLTLLPALNSSLRK